jgi:predicted SprT family Zn-dependent metalloprotease
MPRKTKTKPKPPPTPITYAGLQQLYDHFNARLFSNQLPDVILTLRRQAHSAAYFAPNRFAFRRSRGSTRRGELTLNPYAFVGKSDEWIASVVAHEMVHIWQHTHGTPTTGRYHNRQWADKMKSLGLQPTSTGAPGGRETGEYMDQYVTDGLFIDAFEAIAKTGWKLNQSAPTRRGGKTQGKLKYTCPECQQNAWGLPGLAITCTPCDQPMRN